MSTIYNVLLEELSQIDLTDDLDIMRAASYIRNNTSRLVQIIAEQLVENTTKQEDKERKKTKKTVADD